MCYYLERQNNKNFEEIWQVKIKIGIKEKTQNLFKSSLVYWKNLWYLAVVGRDLHLLEKDSTQVTFTCSKSVTSVTSFWHFVNFEHISHLFLVFLLLTLKK